MRVTLCQLSVFQKKLHFEVLVVVKHGIPQNNKAFLVILFTVSLLSVFCLVFGFVWFFFAGRGSCKVLDNCVLII